MFNKLLNKLLLKEGETEENNEVESQVLGQLDRSAKLDEVDTVTFGLETDDGKIVKVYVKAEQADDFEKALSQKLGEIDDIEECLNELSNEFEIVDVEWPDDKKKDEETPEDAEGEPTTDGSEVMNAAVYKNDKLKEPPKAKMENVEFGDRVAMKLLEDGSSLESRMTTPLQMMIYHAIVELGIPHIALNKSPYKSSIYLSIKQKAIELSKNPGAKVQLKYLLQKMHELDRHHKKDDDAESDDKKHDKHDKKEPVKHDKSREDPREKEVKDDDKHKKHIKESVEELINESLVQDFWECIVKMLNHVGDGDPKVEKLINSTKFKTLVSRSNPLIPRVVKSDLRMKLGRLSDALETAQTKEMGVTESTTPVEFSELLTALFTLVDPTPAKTVSKTLLSSTEFKAFLAGARPKLAQKFAGVVQQKYRELIKSVKNTEATVVTKPTQPPAGAKPTPGNVVESVEPPKKLLVEATNWSFSKDDDDLATISCEGLNFKLNAEQLEKAVKAVASRSAIVVEDAEDPKSKFTFSPRGINLVIKKVGQNTSFQMNSEQVTEFMDLLTDDKKEDKADDKKASKKEEEE